MLIEKTVKKDDVIAAKLISGEEFMARYYSDDEKTLSFTRPRTMMLIPGQNGQASVTFAPFSLGLDVDQREIIIHKDKVMIWGKAAKDSEAGYIRATSKLAIPQLDLSQLKV